MNRFVKITILTLAAAATVITAFDFAAAGDRDWRWHPRAHSWNKRVVVAGIAAGVLAGAVVAARPHVIYRDDPDVGLDSPNDDTDLFDDGELYATPEQGGGDEFYRDEEPDDDYALPLDGQDEDPAYDDRRAAPDDDYFPERPDGAVEAKPADRADDTAGTLPEKKTRKDGARKVAEVDALKPWSTEWRTRCAAKFPSFNPQNGTYLGYDKKRHFCRIG
jgi:hypothetical protein